MKRAIVFAHYDKHGLVDPYVEHLLRAYRPFADRLIVVSAGGLENSLEPLRTWCDVVVRRENIGLDFASWKLGTNYLGDLAAFDEILFTNDSLYGPLFDLSKLFQTIEKWQCDFWGLARSHQIASHVQSYFFAFRRRPIAEGFFRRFWDSVALLTDKDEIINRYEIGMTHQIEQAGYSFQTLFDQYSMSLPTRFRAGVVNGTAHGRGKMGTLKSYVRNRRILNPTHKLWRTLIEGGAPFIKVELMRSNPLGMDLTKVESYISTHSQYDLNLIKNHVRRTR